MRNGGDEVGCAAAHTSALASGLARRYCSYGVQVPVSVARCAGLTGSISRPETAATGRLSCRRYGSTRRARSAPVIALSRTSLTSPAASEYEAPVAGGLGTGRAARILTARTPRVRRCRQPRRTHRWLPAARYPTSTPRGEAERSEPEPNPGRVARARCAVRQKSSPHSLVL